MSLPLYTAFLLLLADSSTWAIFQCKVPKSNTIASVIYTMDVSPTTIISNSTYTVTITGRGNVTVHLQYMIDRPTDKRFTCFQPLPFNHDFDVNNPLVTNFTMFNTYPDDYFIFRALIINGSRTYELAKKLIPVSPPVDVHECKVPSKNTIKFGSYTLDVSPTTVISNSTYTVTITGSGKATVLLQYMLYQPKNQTLICEKPLTFNHDFDVNNTLVTNRTMFTTKNPDDNFIFQAQITTGFITFELSQTLTAASSTDNNNNTALAVHPASMCLEIINVLALLWITGKLL